MNDLNSPVEGWDETINLRAELEKYLRYWKWFVFGALASLTIAFSYLRYATPQYSASALILLKDEQKGAGSAELAAFEDLGILGGSGQNIDNEIEIIKSRKIIGDVIKELNLNISYFTEGNIKEIEVYKNTPISVAFLNKNETHYQLDTLFTVVKVAPTQFELLSEEGTSQGTYNYGQSITSKLGTFKILDTAPQRAAENTMSVKVVVRSLDNLINGYKGALSVAPVGKKSSVVNLSLKSSIRQKAEHFLDALVGAYNRDAIADKNLVSEKTKTFIDERLILVKSDFETINLDLKNYKTSNKVTNIEAEAALAMTSVEEMNAKIVATSIQLTLLKSLKAELLKDTKENAVLPTNLGLDDTSIAMAIVEYNKVLQTKNRLRRTASEQNPSVRNLSAQIEALQSSLAKSLETAKKGIELTLAQLYVESQKIKAKISGIPLQELELGKIRLQQEITSELYAYLLKKKEETAISLAVTVANAKIIDKAYGSNIPIAPKRNIIYLAALLIGVLLPFIVIYIRDLLDSKIHSKKELLAQLNIPFIGSVPRTEDKERLVMNGNTRSSAAESFRLMRTNLDFILSSIESPSKTVFLTSTISGEGKSFTSLNMASTLAVSGKKVILLGMDLRAPKVTEYLGLPNRKGVSNFISDSSLELKDLIFQTEQLKGVDIIASGLIPPNPAELLMSARVAEVFATLRKTYDYIIVDTAPVNLVTDTMLISKYADMFVYVVRANYLDKRLLEIPQNLYNEKRLPNMAVVLNDVNMKKGYGYGGYGYGYGYGASEEKTPWYSKFFGNS